MRAIIYSVVMYTGNSTNHGFHFIQIVIKVIYRAIGHSYGRYVSILFFSIHPKFHWNDGRDLLDVYGNRPNTSGALGSGVCLKIFYMVTNYYHGSISPMVVLIVFGGFPIFPELPDNILCPARIHGIHNPYYGQQ